MSQISSPAAPPPRRHQVACLSPAGVHRMAWHEWGEPDNPRVVVCVHGLTRNGRDFDALAAELATDYRVVCPDVVGRGASDWLAEPAWYAVPQYVNDMVVMLARLEAQELNWVGTSMGGLIGLTLAGMPGGSVAPGQETNEGLMPPIRRLILNDIGPQIEAEGLSRLADYVGIPVEFASFDEAVAYTRQVAASFGPHSEAQWQALTRHAVRPQGTGYVLHYDPAIGQSLQQQRQTADQEAGAQILWRCLAHLQCALTVLRGEQSDILAAATVDRMRQLHPDLVCHEFAGVGHAPSLMARDQIDAVRAALVR